MLGLVSQIHPSVLHLLLNPSWFWARFFTNSTCKEAKEDINTQLQIQYSNKVMFKASSQASGCRVSTQSSDQDH